MKNTRVVIFANGYLSDDFLTDVTPKDVVIGVDRAAYWLMKHGVTPAVAIGDFDSVSASELAKIRSDIGNVHVHPVEKDETDLDLAVGYAVKIKTSHIIIYGGTGSRLDHQTAAVSLLETYHSTGIRILLRDAHNEAFILTGSAEITKDATYHYLSVLPVSRSITVSLSGVKYPVRRKRIRRGSTLGVSNEITAGSALVQIHNGRALIIRSRD